MVIILFQALGMEMLSYGILPLKIKFPNSVNISMQFLYSTIPLQTQSYQDHKIKHSIFGPGKMEKKLSDTKMPTKTL